MTANTCCSLGIFQLLGDEVENAKQEVHNVNYLWNVHVGQGWFKNHRTIIWMRGRAHKVHETAKCAGRNSIEITVQAELEEIEA